MSEKVETGTFDRLVEEVSVACLRGTGTFGIVRTLKTEKAPYVISREQLERLRNVCDVLLKGEA